MIHVHVHFPTFNFLCIYSLAISLLWCIYIYYLTMNSFFCMSKCFYHDDISCTCILIVPIIIVPSGIMLYFAKLLTYLILFVRARTYGRHRGTPSGCVRFQLCDLAPTPPESLHLSLHRSSPRSFWSSSPSISGWIQRMATLGIYVGGIMLTCQIHIHLHLFTSNGIGSIPVRSWSSVLDILFGQKMCRILLDHLF